jgi:hypothetical protein
MDNPRDFHYLLVPVVDKGEGRYDIHPVTNELAALRVDRTEHPILFSQLGQLRQVDKADGTIDVGFMAGRLSNGKGNIFFDFVGPKPVSIRGPNGLFYVSDNKGTKYIVREVRMRPGGGGGDTWIHNQQRGAVVHVLMVQEAQQKNVPAPLPEVVVIPDEEEDEKDEDTPEEQDPVEEPLEDLPEALAPELNSHPLEGVELFANLRPVVPMGAENESAAVLELTNYLIGEMSAMMLEVDKRDRVTWAVFMLQHHLRLRLDKELGHNNSTKARRAWPARFDTFRRLYEHGATVLLHSQGMYGPYDVPSFGETAHDDLHPLVLHQRARGIFSKDPTVRAIASRTAGIRTGEDQVDVIIAMCLHFCRRHAYDIYFVYEPGTQEYTHDFGRFLWALHEDEDWRAEERLRVHLDDYEARLAHPRPHGVDAFHPLLEDGQGGEYNDLEMEHVHAATEADKRFAEEERQALATLQRERQREVQKDKEAQDESPRQRKLPGATPQGSPLGVDARICAGLQRLMSRVMGEPEATRVDLKPRTRVASVAPTLVEVAVTETEEASVLPKLPMVVSEPICTNCNKPGAWARCSVCKTAYCNEICLEADWEAGHEDVCREGGQ